MSTKKELTDSQQDNLIIAGVTVGGALLGLVVGKAFNKNLIAFSAGGAVIFGGSLFAYAQHNKRKFSISKLNKEIKDLYASQGINYSTTDQNADIYVGDIEFR